MANSSQARQERQILTREAAVALVEDLAYIRKLLDLDAPPRDELRRLSGLLRRITVDGEGDLVRVASPRIGKIKLLMPARNAFYSEQPHRLFFASGGALLHGMRLGPFEYGCGAINPSSLPRAAEVFKEVSAPVPNFLGQRILFLEGIWIRRRDVIKYMANYASGVHSKTPQEDADKTLARIRSAFTYSGPTLKIRRDRLIRDTSPFEYDPNALDVVLIELLVAAQLIVQSPDVVRLEEVIREELN